ncbi:MAG: alpha/beta fold hydrolase [Chloroflexi bacterium]|nr:alpha/beta fold hydrolase [Chloroflexota bacterium]
MRAAAEFMRRCETVFVGGLSMGSLLTLYLAAKHPELAGAICYSPALIVTNPAIRLSPLLKHLVPMIRKANKTDTDLIDPEAHLRLWNYDWLPLAAAHELLKLIAETERLLPQVTCPLLVINSTRDQAIHPNSARRTFELVGSRDKELVTLHNSGHCLTVDNEWESVAAKTYEFIQAHALR